MYQIHPSFCVALFRKFQLCRVCALPLRSQPPGLAGEAESSSQLPAVVQELGQECAHLACLHAEEDVHA